MTFCVTSYDLSCIISSHCDILTDWVSLLEDVCELRCSSPCVEPPLLQRSVNRSVQPPLPRSHGWWLPVYTLHAHPARYKYLFIPGKVSFLKVQKSFHKKSGLWTKDSPPPPLHFCTPKWVFFKGKITSGVFFLKWKHFLTLVFIDFPPSSIFFTPKTAWNRTSYQVWTSDWEEEEEEDKYYNEVTGHIRYLIDFKVMEVAAKKLSLSNIYCINQKPGVRIEQQREMEMTHLLPATTWLRYCRYCLSISTSFIRKCRNVICMV